MYGNATKSRGFDPETPRLPSDPTVFAVVIALVISLVLVFLTRLPVARPWAMETDEFGFLEQIRVHWFPMHHTLFMAAGRMLGMLTGDAYRGFVVLDMLMSALALVSLWWWLRALVAPPAAAAGALVMATAPIFWGYGAMAGNYTAILAVGGFLLGVACRTWTSPQSWHPAAAAVVLALGTGYRQDIGTLWLPVFLVILWKHRWRSAVLAGLLFTVLNLAWLLAMLHEAGGWSHYRARTAEFAYHAGYLNSVWNLGLVDAPLRYAVKLSMALLWTLGPCLLFVPRGIHRLRGRENGGFLIFLLFLSVVPALASHMLVHFGVPGYAFHYVPALLALCVLGIGAMDCEGTRAAGPSAIPGSIGTAPLRLVAVATLLAALFLLYPTDYDHAGWRGSFDLSFARLTRVGLRTPTSNRQPALWRTANSPVAAELAAGRR
jgi:Dolichyl-phosphate-mannose-protein mannosyltransferase